jgi:hypothetical protein
MLLPTLLVTFFGKVVHAQQPDLQASRHAEMAAAARLGMPDQPLLSSEQISHGKHLASAKPSKRTGRTLMIVGGAVFLAGLLADEAIISITGVAIGAYGLYVYLEASPKRG